MWASGDAVVTLGTEFLFPDGDLFGDKIARECGLAARINTVMQMAFFHLTQILPGDSALAELQGAIAKSYSSKGQDLARPELPAASATTLHLRCTAC